MADEKDHGLCNTCGEPVDVVVDPFQVVGNGKFLCVPCRVKRMEDKTMAEVGKLKEKAEKAREDLRQGSLDLEE